MLVKAHISKEGKKIVSICDNNLIGRKFEEKDLQLDLSGSFYKGSDLSEAETLKIIKDAYLINVVGEKSINFCINKNYILKKNVFKIKNIPYAQAMILSE